MKLTEVMINAAARAKSLDELSKLASDILANDPTFYEDGSVSYGRQVVLRCGAVRIEVRPNEHPPPHFHVIGPNISASFAIRNGELLKGNAGPSEMKVVSLMYKGGRNVIIRAWNNSRPSDCPVGLFCED